MGEILEEGLLGEVDESKAYEYYRKASGLSDPLGMVKMGHSFEKGISVEQNHAKAIEWYKRAVENGSTEGMAQL
ncbi:MAG: tetratricopeptide repeat protein, partial [Opitutales bacterium]